MENCQVFLETEKINIIQGEIAQLKRSVIDFIALSHLEVRFQLRTPL